MIIQLFRLKCDCCGKEHKEAFDTVKDLLKYTKMDIPKELIRYMERNDIEYQWYDMREKFWKENRESTFKFFSELPEGHNIICSTVFLDFQQLELVLQVLHKLMHKHFTFKIMNGALPEDLVKFYEESESSITPDELEKQLEADRLTDDEAEAVYEKIYAFKKQINENFLEVLQAHEVYWIGHFRDVLLKNMDDIKNAIRE